MKYIFGTLFFCIILTFILFREIPSMYFFSDDFVWLLEAKQHTVKEIPLYLYQSEGFFYRPTTKLYFWVMWQFFQADPMPYHVVNLVLNFFVAIVVFFLSLMLFDRFTFSFDRREDRYLVAGGISLLFYTHPSHYENIVWPSAITELIPALCVLIGMLLSARYFTLTQKSPVPWVRRFINLFFLLLVFVIGLGGHEYVVVFPLLVFVLHAFILQKFSPVKLIGEQRILYLSLIACDVGYLILRWLSNAHWSGGDYSYNLTLLPFNFLGNLLGYVGLFIVGIPFITWYSYLREFFRSNIIFAFIALLCLFFVILLFFLYRVRKREQGKDVVLESNVSLATKKSRLYHIRFLFENQLRNSPLLKVSIFSFLFFVVTLLPFLGLGGLAERYLYLSSFGLCFFVGAVIYTFARFVERYTESISVFSAFALVIGSLLCFYVYSTRAGVESWQVASSLTASRMEEFQNNCDQFSEGETLVRISPINRYERAWVFQVGYEEGANVYCDKNLRILRK